MYALGLYVDAGGAKRALSKFKGKSGEELAKDQKAYDGAWGGGTWGPHGGAWERNGRRSAGGGRRRHARAAAQSCASSLLRAPARQHPTPRPTNTPPRAQRS